MKPDYLKVIDDVAREYSTLETYEQKLLRSWRSFESLAASLNPQYDVLNPLVPRRLIQEATDFINLLYENNDSSPMSDCDQIREKDAAYGGSWHARGGTGAFHAFARKGDRLVSMLNKHGSLEKCRLDKTNSESIDDTIGDLRRYLILMVAWHWTLPPEEKVVHYEAKSGPIVGEKATQMLLDDPEPPPIVSKPCPECKHPLDTHDEDGCNGLDTETGTVCGCSRRGRG